MVGAVRMKNISLLGAQLQAQIVAELIGIVAKGDCCASELVKLLLR